MGHASSRRWRSIIEFPPFGTVFAQNFVFSLVFIGCRRTQRLVILVSFILILFSVRIRSRFFILHSRRRVPDSIFHVGFAGRRIARMCIFGSHYSSTASDISFLHSFIPLSSPSVVWYMITTWVDFYSCRIPGPITASIYGPESNNLISHGEHFIWTRAFCYVTILEQSILLLKLRLGNKIIDISSWNYVKITLRS